MAGQSAAFRERLLAATAALIDLRPAVEAGRPWPLGIVEPGAGEDAWGPPEVLAHVAEMLPYWLGEAERVLEGATPGARLTTGVASGEPVPFGRVEADELRILRIAQDRTLPLGELFARIEADAGRWDRRLVSFGAMELATVGRHPRRGEMTVADMLEPFVVGHLEGHVAQLRRALEAAEAGG